MNVVLAINVFVKGIVLLMKPFEYDARHSLFVQILELIWAVRMMGQGDHLYSCSQEPLPAFWHFCLAETENLSDNICITFQKFRLFQLAREIHDPSRNRKRTTTQPLNNIVTED